MKLKKLGDGGAIDRGAIVLGGQLSGGGVGGRGGAIVLDPGRTSYFSMR